MSRAMKVQGIECPIIREGDPLEDIVVDSVLKGVEYNYNDWDIDGNPKTFRTGQYLIEDKSVIGITESTVARAYGQYVMLDRIASNVIDKFGKDATICLVNPIYSRNRFAMILKGIARAAKRVIIEMPEYDEVGNPRRINPFTGVNIEDYYKELCESENCECNVNSFNNWGLETDTIYCGLHDYIDWKHKFGDEWHYTLADICSDKSPDWGVLGTNKATEEKLKLFPSRELCDRVCLNVKNKIKEKTGKDVIVCVYGDGCFHSPTLTDENGNTIPGTSIWEFADPITMPGYTDKELIESSPCEVKLKYAIDSQHSSNNRTHDDMEIKDNIDILKSDSIKNYMKGGSLGTTPRMHRDLLASIMDLTSGSGDRGTPVVLVQNYF